MDTALKQRLLGAAVLIALAVIFLPMLFSGTAPEPERASVSLEIPAVPENDLQSRVYDVSPEAPAEGILEKSAAPILSKLLPAKDDVKEPTLNPDVAVRDEPVEVPAKAPSEPSPPAAPVAAVDGAPGTAVDARFVVSLGVYADAANAQAQLQRAKGLGYPVYAESTKVDGKPATGVRAGPFANRVQAEAARLKLAASLGDIKPSLVALTENRNTDMPASAVAADEAGSWAVQLAAYRQRTDALKLRERAREAGFEAFIDEVNSADGHWWRVRVGPRTQRADAEDLQGKLKARLDIDGIVVTHP